MITPVPPPTVVEFAGMGYYERPLETRLVEGRLQYKDYPTENWKWADECKDHISVRLEDGTTRPFGLDDAQAWVKDAAK